MLFEARAAAAAAAPRRQGPDRLERPDDRRVRPRRARAAAIAAAASAISTAAQQRRALHPRRVCGRRTTGRLLRRYRDGDAAIDGYAEDYACLISGCSSCSRRTAIRPGSSGRVALQEQQDELFWDRADGGWFSTTGTDPTVLLRLKEDYDGAEPSAGSLATHNLLTLAHLVGGGDYLAQAEQTLARYGARAGTAARAIPMMLAALSAWHARARQVVDRRRPDARATAARCSRELARHYRPFAVVVPVTPGPAQAALAGSPAVRGAMSARRRGRRGLRLPRLHLPGAAVTTRRGARRRAVSEARGYTGGAP